MWTSVIGFFVLAMTGTIGGAQGPDPELGKLKGTWIASGVWHNGQRKADLFETHFRSMLVFYGKDDAQFLGGQLGAPEGFGWLENMKVRALPEQKQLVFSFAANKTKGKQKAVVSCSYTLKEGDTTDELILNFEDGKKSEKWTFHRVKPKKPGPAPQPPAKKEKKGTVHSTERVTLNYIAGLDDQLPPRTFLAIDDAGNFSGPVGLTWDIPPEVADQKKAFDTLLKKLNDNGIETGIRVTFKCRGEWLDPKTTFHLAQAPGQYFYKQLRVTGVLQQQHR